MLLLGAFWGLFNIARASPPQVQRLVYTSNSAGKMIFSGGVGLWAVALGVLLLAGACF